MCKNVLLLVLTVFLGETGFSHAQSPPSLLLDKDIQIEATQAVNDLYNFKFESAEQQFRWLKQKYGWHPLPYFLMGLSQWWKITPNIEVEKYDGTFYAYMDTAIYLAQRLYDLDENNIEAAFFLSAAYAFKGRLLSERKNWRKAATAGKNALKYLEVSKGNKDFSPELLFGDALYNYYSVWVPENYPLLKPILMFFPKGDKELGVKQLREVAMNAFYTRTEAQFFLMRILASEENDMRGALQVAQYLHETFPDNSYFHRYYARLLYHSGKFRKAEKVCLDIMSKIDKGMVGYEEVTGRYASFFLGQIYAAYKLKEMSKHYYQRAVDFGEKIKAYDSGYYLHSLLSLAEYEKEAGNMKQAKKYVKQVKKKAKRGSPAFKRAKHFFDEES